MGKEYFFLYLIYGFTFINMGLFAIKDKDIEVSNLPLIRSLKYLGYFGITHGVSEWITMVTITDLYDSSNIWLFILKQLLKAISFLFLMFFGVSLVPMRNEYRRIALKIPVAIFTVWLGGFMFLIVKQGSDYHMLNPKYNIILLRYIMAFLGGTISALALYLNAKELKNRKLYKMANRYNSLSFSFLVYGFFEGVIVRQVDFFPANIINSTWFLQYMMIPTQIFKTFLGITINVLLIKVIDTFGWEQKEKLNRLQKLRISSEERRNLGLEIHDSIIQDLYAAGLKIEYLMKNKKEVNRVGILKEIKSDLNNTIAKTREFLSETALDTIELEDLNDYIHQLVKKFNENQNIKINIECEMLSHEFGKLSPEKSTQIYYIVQEALSNIIKHSEAESADVLLEAKYDYLYIEIKDKGVGISLENIDREKHFGIQSMKERTERIGGVFTIEKIRRGTKIELIIPWEE